MRGLTLVVFATAVCLISASPVRAENWAKVSDYSSIDADSIRKGLDGLVYYTMKDDYGKFYFAVDCGKRLSYSVGPDGTKKGDPLPVEASSPASYELDFICSRA